MEFLSTNKEASLSWFWHTSTEIYTKLDAYFS